MTYIHVCHRRLLANLKRTALKIKDHQNVCLGQYHPRPSWTDSKAPCGQSGASLIWVLLFVNFFKIQYSPLGDHWPFGKASPSPCYTCL